MTLQTNPPISMADVLNELKIANSSRTYPISLLDSDVKTLSGLQGTYVDLYDLCGKSAAIKLTGAAVDPVSWTGNSSTLQTSVNFSLLYFTPSNATGPFSYQWVNTGGTPVTVNSPTSSSTTFSYTVPSPNTTVISKYRLQINGPANSAQSGEITLTFTRGSYLFATLEDYSDKTKYEALPDEVEFLRKYLEK